MALIWIIFVIVIVTVIVTSMFALSLADTRYASKQEQKTQAQYVARSGAVASLKYILANPYEFNPNTFTTKTIPDTTMGEGYFSAVITKPFFGGLVVRSTGVVAGISETVSVSLSKGNYNGIFKGVRQTRPGNLDISAMPVTYEPGSTVQIEANVTSLNQITLASTNNSDPNIVKSANSEPLPPVVLPSNYTSYPYRAVMSGDNVITGNMWIGRLAKGNNQNIVFDTQGVEQFVVVDNLDITGPHGALEVVGTGVVHLFIRTSGSIDTPVNANTREPSKLFIYVADGVTMALQANCQLNAYLYGPNAIIEIQSDQTQIRGSIIGNILQRNSNQGVHGQFHFVPLPDNTDYTGIMYYKADYFSN